MLQPSEPDVRSGAGRAASRRGSAARVLAGVLLLGIAAWVAWQAVGVLAD
jgi:hypothetical protein